MASATPVIATNEIRLTYGANTITDDLSISLATGKVTAIVGPNGCGKSTVLRSFARLLKPSGGAVYLNGEDREALKGTITH